MGGIGSRGEWSCQFTPVLHCHTHSLANMWKLAPSCTALPRMTLTVTHLLGFKQRGWQKRSPSDVLTYKGVSDEVPNPKVDRSFTTWDHVMNVPRFVTVVDHVSKDTWDVLYSRAEFQEKVIQRRDNNVCHFDRDNVWEGCLNINILFHSSLEDLLFAQVEYL